MGSSFKKQRAPPAHIDIIYWIVQGVHCIWSYGYIANHQQFFSIIYLFTISFEILAREQVFIHNFSEVRWERRKISKTYLTLLSQFSKYIQNNKKINNSWGILVLCTWCYIFGQEKVLDKCFQPSPPSFFQLSSPCLQFVNLPYIWMAFFSGSFKCQKGYFKGKRNQTLQYKEYKWEGKGEDFIYMHTTGIFLNLSLPNSMCCCSDMIAVDLSTWYLKYRWCDTSTPVNSQAIDLKSTY